MTDLLLQHSLKTDKKLMAQYLMKIIGEKIIVTLDSRVQAKPLLLTVKKIRDPHTFHTEIIHAWDSTLNGNYH